MKVGLDQFKEYVRRRDQGKFAPLQRILPDDHVNSGIHRRNSLLIYPRRSPAFVGDLSLQSFPRLQPRKFAQNTFSRNRKQTLTGVFGECP